MPFSAKQHRATEPAPRATSTERGYGYDWQRLRALHIAEHPLCAACEQEGLVEPAVDVDHVIPHCGDDALRLDPTNLRSLCKRHHGIKTARDVRAQLTR